MATFSTITTGTKYLSRDIVNEVVLAYSERRQCVGNSAVAGVPVGFNLQSLDFWRGMQEWIESSVTDGEWVNDGVAISGATSVTYYTLASFRAAAGCASGFRRATTWPTDWTDYFDAAYSYGTIQSGDILGPWIVEDLQKALDSLRWTVGTGGASISNREYKTSSASSSASYAAAVAAASSGWPGSWTSGFVYTSDYYYDVTFETSFDGLYNCQAIRQRFDLSYTIPSHIAVSYSFFIIPSSAYNYNNTDGYTDSVYSEVKSGGPTTTSLLTIPSVSLNTFPVPSSYTDGLLYTADSFAAESLILKWQFSHTL